MCNFNQFQTLLKIPAKRFEKGEQTFYLFPLNYTLAALIIQLDVTSLMIILELA